MIAKVKQCRRLARQINDHETAQRLLDLADEYVQKIKYSLGHQTTK
jgi:hypothetical protein